MSPLSHLHPPVLLPGSPFISSLCPYIQTSSTDTRLQSTGLLLHPQCKDPQLYSLQSGQVSGLLLQLLTCSEILIHIRSTAHQFKRLQCQEQNNFDYNNTELLRPGFSSAVIYQHSKGLTCICPHQLMVTL